jgi:hypothetical protein
LTAPSISEAAENRNGRVFDFRKARFIYLNDTAAQSLTSRTD